MSAEDHSMSAEEPKPETPAEPAPPVSAPASPPASAPPASPPPPPPQAAEAAPAAASSSNSRIFVIAALVVIALALGGYFLARSGLLGAAQTEEAYAVAPFAPQQALVSARERVLAHAEPDAASPVVVMFGAGAVLDINGRVSRGIGNDWYRIAWNGQTAFVRQQDAVAGGEAPPGIADRPKPEELEEEKPAEEEKPDEAELAEFPPLPSTGFSLSDVRWIREPSARDFARFYPHRALDQGRSGRVVLDCVITGRGGLDCSVAEENPSGWGFGDAAVNIARQARVEPMTRDGRSIAGEHLRLPLQFRAD